MSALLLSSLAAFGQSTPTCSDQDLAALAEKVSAFDAAQQNLGFTAAQAAGMALQYEKQQLSSTYQVCNPSHPQKAQAEKVVPQATATRHNGRPARGQTTAVVTDPQPVVQTVAQATAVEDQTGGGSDAGDGAGSSGGGGVDANAVDGGEAGAGGKGNNQVQGAPVEKKPPAGDKSTVTRVDIDVEPPDPKELVACSDVVLSFNMSRAQNSPGQADLTDAAISASWSSGDKTSGAAGKNPATTDAASKSTPTPLISAITLTPVAGDATKATGTFTIYRIPAGTQKVALNLTSPFGYDTQSAAFDLSVAVPDAKNGPPGCIRPMPPLLLTAVGVDVEAASSTSPGATFLLNGTLDLPLLPAGSPSNPVSNIRKPRLFIGGSLRIAGMAQPGDLSASAFTSAGYYASAINAAPDKIVQSWEGVGSLSIRIGRVAELGAGTFDAGKPSYLGYPRRTLISTSLLLSGGFNSALSASQANPPVYYATTQIQQAYPNVFTSSVVPNCVFNTTKGTWPCTVAFVPEDRERFYRHYEAGLRFRIYGEDFEHNMLRFPGIVDLTAGQNEYVTGGRLNGTVLHIGGVLPLTLPIPKFDGIYVFGALDSAVNGPITSCTAQNQPCSQLLLTPVPATANLTYLSPSVYDVTVAQPNRDRYRFGFGVDILHLLAASQQKQ